MRERQEGVRWERTVAAASAMVLTASGLWVLSRVPAYPVATASATTEASNTTLVMLPPPATRPAVPARSPTRRADAVRGAEHRPHRRGAPASRMVGSLPAAGVEPAGGTPPSRPLDLRVPAAPDAPVAVAPWTRAPRDDLARTPVVTARMQDNSLMGKLSRGGRAMECAELRAALGKPSASAEVILASMRKRGCD